MGNPYKAAFWMLLSFVLLTVPDSGRGPRGGRALLAFAPGPSGRAPGGRA